MSRQKLDQTSRSLGISAEALQTLQLIAAKANAPEDAIIGMFENIDKARQEALKGNVELQASFQRLGVSLGDLQNMTKSDLFGAVVANIPANIQKAPNMARQDVQAITGTPENIVNQIVAQTAAGGGFNNTMNQAKEEGTIVNESDINTLSATYKNVVYDLKQLGTELKPLAAFLLGILDTLINALGGILNIIKGGVDVVLGIIRGDWDKIG